MGIPQIIVLSLYGVSAALALHMHGKKKKEANIPFLLASACVFVSLLTWGGFFAAFGIPQIIYVVLLVAGIGGQVLGEPPERDWDFFAHVLGMGIILVL